MTTMSGHRLSYAELLASELNLSISEGRLTARKAAQLIKARAVLLGTIDDDYIGFLLISFVRALLGKRTAGIFLRPQSCFRSKSIRSFLKYMSFWIVNGISSIHVFTIIPFSICPYFQRISRYGLMDPQMWDLDNSRNRECQTTLSSAVTNAKADRRVLSFLGSVDELKGILFLLRLVQEPRWSECGICLVIAGRFPDPLKPIAQELRDKGVIVVDRHITDDELLSLYSVSDLIWACYHPDYDQASGIFGRAIQQNVVPIIRADSLIERVSVGLGTSTIALRYNDTAEISKLLEKRSEVNTDFGQHDNMRTMTKRWRDEFFTKLSNAL